MPVLRPEWGTAAQAAYRSWRDYGKSRFWGAVA